MDLQQRNLWDDGDQIIEGIGPHLIRDGRKQPQAADKYTYPLNGCDERAESQGRSQVQMGRYPTSHRRLPLPKKMRFRQGQPRQAECLGSQGRACEIKNQHCTRLLGLYPQSELVRFFLLVIIVILSTAYSNTVA